MFSDSPRALRIPEVLEERRQLHHTAPHVQPLNEWAASLQKRRNAVVPFFDPADAGVAARVMLLLEAPGPMTNSDNPRPGSGFISIDNDDETAANTWRARSAAGLSEQVAMHWNAVPWYLGTARVKPMAQDRRDGARELVDLMRQLDHLAVVVLCGRHAQRMWDQHVRPTAPPIEVLETWHPSPLSLWRPERRAHFEETLKAAAQSVGIL